MPEPFYSPIVEALSDPIVGTNVAVPQTSTDGSDDGDIYDENIALGGMDNQADVDDFE